MIDATEVAPVELDGAPVFGVQGNDVSEIGMLSLAEDDAQFVIVDVGAFTGTEPSAQDDAGVITSDPPTTAPPATIPDSQTDTPATEPATPRRIRLRSKAMQRSRFWTNPDPIQTGGGDGISRRLLTR